MRLIYTDAEQAAARALARRRYPPKRGITGLGLDAPKWLKLLAEVRSGRGAPDPRKEKGPMPKTLEEFT